MNSENPQKNHGQECSATPELIHDHARTCVECGQTYLFQDTCPECDRKFKERSESIVLAATVKNLMDRASVVELYNMGSGNLRKIHDILFSNLTLKGDPNV